MIGDDQLQKRAGRVPQSLTHGISKQRASWFAKGFSRLTISTSATHSARVGCSV
jgi:predicted metalloprotease